jgi:Ca-activated chloride channel homolog
MKMPCLPRSAPSLGLSLALSFFPWIAEAQMRVEPRATNETSTIRSSLSLHNETIHVDIEEQHATTKWSQLYINKTNQVLEGVCSIRAGQNTKVKGFAYYNGNTKIKGEVFEREAARQIYEETKGQQRDPGLLEMTGEGAFSFRVFPIQPNEHKRIEVTLTQRLPRAGKHVEYRVPLGSSTSNLTVSVKDSRAVGAFSSPTHHLVVNEVDGVFNLTLAPKTKKETEFVLGYDVLENPYELSIVKHEDPGQPAYLAISMGTDPTATSTPKDVTIVLDHSGSMDGTPLTEARTAAKEIVSRLRAQDHLNILAFDDRTDSLFSSMQPVTAQSRASALRFLDDIQSGGGTDIAAALQEALKKQRSGAERPIVLLLTDGASDAEQVFSVAEKDTSTARVFTIGLGSGVNRPLLSRLSDMKRGRFTYIQSANAIVPSVSRLFSLVETAALKNPELVIENGHLTQIQPSTLPDLAPGEELFVTTRATGQGPVKVMLKGIAARGPVKSQAMVVLGSPSTHPWVGRLWAQDRTNRLLEDISLKGETDERKNETIELSLSYGFVTPYTSFLAIPENELTSTTTTLMHNMREQKRAILAKRTDAVALSRSEMPPGDPVLTVNAPADALRVTAYFPFGLKKELSYDQNAKRWSVRFLVPKEVPDGKYTVPILVVTRNGQLEYLSGNYTIDSSEPEFETTVKCTNGTMKITVVSDQPLREVRAALVDTPSRHVQFRVVPNVLHRYDARLKLSRDDQVRIVVTDRARNEAEEIVQCPLTDQTR